MIQAVVAGIVLTIGANLVRRGLWPSPPALSELLREKRVEATQQALRSERKVKRGKLGRRLDPILGPRSLKIFSDLRSPRLVKDLRVSGYSPEQLGASRAILLLAPLIWLTLAVTLALFGIVTIPIVAVLVIATLIGIGAWYSPKIILASEASEAREEFRFALSAYLDLVSVNLLGGSRVQESMHAAVNAGKGWVFRELKHALGQTQQGRQAWDALAELAQEVDVVELEEVTSSMTLAGVEGARVGDTLTAKAESLRSRRLTEAEAKAGRKSEQMSFGLAILALGLLFFILFPILSNLGADVSGG